jgi:hypothetical protein
MWYAEGKQASKARAAGRKIDDEVPRRLNKPTFAKHFGSTGINDSASVEGE